MQKDAKSTREAWVCRSLSYYVEVCLYKAFKLLSTDFHNKHTNKHRQTLIEQHTIAIAQPIAWI